MLNDESKPMILKVIAKAFLKAIEKGDYRYISEIMQQARKHAIEICFLK